MPPPTLRKEEAVHYDSMGNTRTVTFVVLTSTYRSRDYEFISKSEYRIWLGFTLKMLGLKIGELVKSKNKTLYEVSSYKSLYTIEYEDGFWNTLLIIPTESPGRGIHNEDDIFSSFAKALASIKEQPTNYDFEVITPSNSELFSMTEEDMVIATLKYSDYQP